MNLFQNKKFLSVFILAIIATAVSLYSHQKSKNPNTFGLVKSAEQNLEAKKPVLDIQDYEQKLLQTANLPSPTSSLASLWPAKAAYPNYGALLPYNRIVAYYGNLYSKGMGVLGEYPEDVMLDKLSVEVKKWEAADPNTPVIPALHYITVVAQAGPGKDGKYRARMPDKEINKVLEIAKKINGLVFLDFQVGLSNVQTELPIYKDFFKLPNVHVGIDPEFAMKGNIAPGRAIGTLDAGSINWAADYLAQIVKDNDLSPKILIVHRFTKPMVTNAKNIKPLPEVQIVMDMDGFGSKGSKLNTYTQYIQKEPVQFTGFKLFYKNDTANQRPLFSPQELLKLTPIPSYIQFQ